MRQHTAAPAPVTVKHGALTIVITRPVDGGFAINTFTGPIREDNLCLTTPDRPTAELAFRVIRDGGNQRVSPEGIHAALQDALRSELTRSRDKGNHGYADRVDALLDRMTTPAQAEAERVALAGIANNIRNATGELSALGRIREAHAAGMERARAERSAA